MQKWCVDNGWLLVWALGSGLDFTSFSFTNGDWYSYYHRAVDPDVATALGAATNASVASAAGKSKFDDLWTEVARLRNNTASGEMPVEARPRSGLRMSRADVFRRLVGAAPPSPSPPPPPGTLNFTALWQEMPALLATAPLSADQCSEPARCIGTWVASGGDCICYNK